MRTLFIFFFLSIFLGAGSQDSTSTQSFESHRVTYEFMTFSKTLRKSFSIKLRESEQLKTVTVTCWKHGHTSTYKLETKLGEGEISNYNTYTYGATDSSGKFCRVMLMSKGGKLRYIKFTSVLDHYTFVIYYPDTL